MSAWSEREIEEEVGLPPVVSIELARELENSFIAVFDVPNAETSILVEARDAHGTHRSNSTWNIDDSDIVGVVEHLRVDMRVRGTRAVLSVSMTGPNRSNWIHFSGTDGAAVGGCASQARRLIERWQEQHPSVLELAEASWRARAIKALNSPWALGVGSAVIAGALLKLMGLV